MTGLSALPDKVVHLIRSSSLTQFATVSGAGVPIDTPLLVFPPEDLSTIDVATGLAYPAKAARARRNPAVGLLLEGGPDEPVVSIAGVAAVRDSDIEANALRYISEVGAYGTALHHPWEVAREAVWYWSRIIIEVTPKRVLWWDDPAAMDQAPQRWDAPADQAYPASDPVPPGAGSAPSKWPEFDWREQARAALDRNARGHLTLLDHEGFPLPIAVRDAALSGDQFELDVPKAVPWVRVGVATLTFEGRATFVGPVTGAGASTRLQVQRMLPIQPMVMDTEQMWRPRPEVKEVFMKRLEHELRRREQDIPDIPADKPAPTPGALRRRARAMPTLREEG